MFVDYIQNGQGHGEVGNQLAACRFDPGLMRPFINNRGQKCVTVDTGDKKYDKTLDKYLPIYKTRLVSDMMANGANMPLANATSLRKDEWIELDRVVIRAARQRLRAWSDLSAANSFGGFNGMSRTVLEHETMSDPGEAIVDMDGLTEGRTDVPRFQLQSLPLPITHSDFYFSSRKLAVSRNTGTPLDTTMAEAAARRVAESIEKTLIGIDTGITYAPTPTGGRASTVFGYTNFTDRITKSDMTAPDGTNGPTVLTEWLAVRDLLYDANFYGPFMVYNSTDYDQFLDNLFSTTEPSAGTLRSRLLQIDGISGIRRLDFLTNTFTLIFVQMTSDVARAINGMDMTTVQWETRGGMQLNFKVMAIQVPQLRADFNGNTGIAHATTA